MMTLNMETRPPTVQDSGRKTKLVKISILVTEEQYEFLKKLRKQKVSMSSFLRGLLALYMNGNHGNNVMVVYERRAVTEVSERRIVVTQPSMQSSSSPLPLPSSRSSGPLGRGYGKFHAEIMEELKSVLAKRRKMCS